jgi:surface antigen
MSVALLTTIGLVGCSSNTQNENTGVGAVTGAAVGGVGAGLLHASPAGIAAGVVGGAIIGGVIGHSMDSTDSTTSYTVIKSNPTNQTTKWVNHKTGVTYTMTPTSDLFTVNGNPNCRKFYFTATKHGKMHHHNGTACLMQDGNWHSVH